MPYEKRDFDLLAAAWDDNPHRVALAKGVASSITNIVPVRSDWEALDYGCGTGLLTLALLPSVGHIVGADNSQGMLDVLKTKTESAEIENAETLKLDLETEPIPDRRFDLIASSMTLHHIADPAGVIAKLIVMLKPGGWIALADLDTEDGSFHVDDTGVLHFGLDRDYVVDALQRSGITDIKQTTAFNMTRENGREYPIFMISGRKM